MSADQSGHGPSFTKTCHEISAEEVPQTGHGLFARTAYGTSQILSKGQQYSASAGLRRVTFRDFWTFKQGNGTRYLDATCILYKGKKHFRTIDYSHQTTADLLSSIRAT
jgi:hypothetical protein